MYLWEKVILGYDILVYGIKDEDEECICELYFFNGCIVYCKMCDILICKFCFFDKYSVYEIL